MPAITVDDLTVLRRITAPGSGRPAPSRLAVTTAPQGFEGEGFPVRRAFAGIDLQHLDPFIMMDQMGEVDYAPGEPKGTPWHPHRGFETVTYIIDGSLDHQDSHGGGGTITNGDTQWMTAGSGILHIEAPPEWLVQKGGLFHGIQLWVNLPRDAKLTDPTYQDLRCRRGRPRHHPRRGRAGARHRRRRGRAGERLRGRRTPRCRWCTRPSQPGARLELPWPVDFNALVYVLSGQGTVGHGPAADPDWARPPCSAPATSSRSPRTSGRTAARRRSTWSSSAAGRSASRWPGPGRS